MKKYKSYGPLTVIEGFKAKKKDLIKRFKDMLSKDELDELIKDHANDTRRAKPKVKKSNKGSEV